MPHGTFEAEPPGLAQLDDRFWQGGLAQLEAEGLTVWYDADQIELGDDFRWKMIEGLNTSRFGVVVISPRFTTYWTQSELSALLTQESTADEERVLPVMLDMEWDDLVRRDPFLGARKVARAADGPQAVAEAVRRVVDKARRRSSLTRVSTAYQSENHQATAERLDGLILESQLPDTSDDRRRTLQEQILTLKRSLRDGPQLVPGADLQQRYHIDRRLGHGGFATVSLAIDRQLRMPAAVKVLHGQHNKNDDRSNRFFRGARIMTRLDHPNIVRVLQPRGQDDGYQFFVMEYLEGGDLAARLMRARSTR